jgi:cytoskeletal protein CcmA (bactofilin family)
MVSNFEEQGYQPGSALNTPESYAGDMGQTMGGGLVTVIDRQSYFNGTYRSDSDLRIEGMFEGEIECKGTVTIAPAATLSATVKARNVVVAGSANGDFTCDESFTIRSTGEMRGKAQAATLIVEEGALFEGEFKMVDSGLSSLDSGLGSWGENHYATPSSAVPTSTPAVDDQNESALYDLGGAESDTSEADEAWETRQLED